MAPTDGATRYGYVPFNWICQQGLFIHPFAYEKYVTGVGEIKDIACNDWKKSKINLYADVKFDLEQTLVNIRFKESFTGYGVYESGISPIIYASLSETDKKTISERIINQVFADAKPDSVTVTGYNEKDLFRTPFTFAANFSTNSVLEKAGNKYLFKVGELIGPQAQLYENTSRHSVIETQFNKGYRRELSFIIPDGYKISNPDAVNMDVSDGADSARTMEFHSYYRTDGNKVTVIVDEDYRQIRFPVSMYEQFRKVINTSADFNKVVLILEKR
jgi:hypothetical protein